MKTQRMKDVVEATCSEQYERALFRAVVRQMGSTWNELWEHPEDFRDASAGISGFTYYSETEPFAKRNLENIVLCLNDFESEIGEPLKKDKDNLMNWYAWFALEHIIDRIMTYKENY